MILTLLFGLLGFLIYSTQESTVFSWLLGISGLAVIFAWGSICLCHIRFRAAWTRQGNSLAELPWTSPLGIMGSYSGLFMSLLVLIAYFYRSAFPIGEGKMTPQDRAYAFFENMLSLVIVLVFFIAYKIYHRTRLVRIEDMDLQTGRREAVPLEVLEQERAEKRSLPLYKKILSFIF